MPNPEGDLIRRPFTQKYNVIAPPTGATVAADLMNVLYAGFDNPISVSASGVPANKISVSMTGGTLTPRGNGSFIARPAAVGQDVTFNVTGVVGGRTQTMGSFTFKVRKLPDPTAYIIVGDDRSRGGRIAKAPSSVRQVSEPLSMTAFSTYRSACWASRLYSSTLWGMHVRRTLMVLTSPTHSVTLFVRYVADSVSIFRKYGP